MTDDLITLVTSDDPPVELTIEREKLLDSRVFSDMLSLPSTSSAHRRVEVAERSRDLLFWVEWLKNGAVDYYAEGGDESNIWPTVLSVAKLIDKYDCTVAKYQLIAEMWRLLREGPVAPCALLVAADMLQAGTLAKYAAAAALAFDQPRDVKRIMVDAGYIADPDRWEARLYV
ncbi:hypothetical protein JCM10908_003740 [Rhodotorula pacifica]|uniref:uncharacterized protein n=1 Tax=Rhodotorula pacifica TaxID=1495444 RepID=UPI00316B7E8C